MLTLQKRARSVFMIRGNHESAPVTVQYGFFAECVVKADEETWQRVCEVRGRSLKMLQHVSQRAQRA